MAHPSLRGTGLPPCVARAGPTHQVAGAAVPELHLLGVDVDQLLGHRADVAVPVHVLKQEPGDGGDELSETTQPVTAVQGRQKRDA